MWHTVHDGVMMVYVYMECGETEERVLFMWLHSKRSFVGADVEKREREREKEHACDCTY
jgi:hypothetical protein